VDDLRGLDNNGYYTIGYADYIAILIKGKFLQTMPEVLHTVQQWCKRTKLSINPNKSVVIPFTWKRAIKGLKEPILFNKTIQLSSEVKYLGITLDKGLTWTWRLEPKGDILDTHCSSETQLPMLPLYGGPELN
jgi:hypothetical protein